MRATEPAENAFTSVLLREGKVRHIWMHHSSTHIPQNSPFSVIYHGPLIAQSSASLTSSAMSITLALSFSFLEAIFKFSLHAGHAESNNSAPWFFISSALSCAKSSENSGNPIGTRPPPPQHKLFSLERLNSLSSIPFIALIILRGASYIACPLPNWHGS